MNLSARLNLFLGVRNLHAEFLPDHLAYLVCYLKRAPMNRLFPVSVTLGTAAAACSGARPSPRARRHTSSSASACSPR